MGHISIQFFAFLFMVFGMAGAITAWSHIAARRYDWRKADRQIWQNDMLRELGAFLAKHESDF